MMSDKCAPALDVSVEEQDSFGSFGEDSVQTVLSLALADPEGAKKWFPAYRLTRLVTARFDMDDTEARIFADLARPLATVRLLPAYLGLAAVEIATNQRAAALVLFERAGSDTAVAPKIRPLVSENGV